MKWQGGRAAGRLRRRSTKINFRLNRRQLRQSDSKTASWIQKGRAFGNCFSLFHILFPVRPADNYGQHMTAAVRLLHCSTVRQLLCATVYR